MAGENVLRLQILMKKVTDDYYRFFVTLPKIKREQYLILLKGKKNLEMTYDVYFSSANHPDNWLTIARQSTVCLSECYDEKPDGLTVFQ